MYRYFMKKWHFTILHENGLTGTCCNDCPGVRELQVGIGAVAGLTAVSLAGSFRLSFF